MIENPSVTINVNIPYTFEDEIHNVRILSITSPEIDFLAYNTIVIIEKDGEEIINKCAKKYLKIFDKKNIYFDDEFKIINFKECKITLKIDGINRIDSCLLHYMVL